MNLKLNKEKIYYFIFFILFFVSYNITIYGYFISRYLLIALTLFSIVLIFLLGIKKGKIKRKNLLFTIGFILICLIFSVRNQQLNKDFTSNCWILIGLLLLFVLQFSDDWVKVPYKIIDFFTFEHVFGTYFCYIFSDFYKSNILPIFSGNTGYADLINQVNQNMIAGFTTNYGSNATYLVIGFLSLFVRYIQKGKKSKKDILILSIIYLALLLTGKRGTLIFGTITAIMIYFILNKENVSSKIFKGIFGGIILIIVLVIASGFIPNVSMIYDRIFNSSNLLNGRERLYDLAWTLFSDNPLVGIGWGNFKYYYSNFYNVAEQLNVHNVYLQLLCEIGIVGTFIILGFMLHSLIKPYKMLKKDEYSCFKKELSISFAIQLFILLVGISSTPIYGVEALYPYLVSCVIPYAINYYTISIL